jgi:uncharacterized protein
LELRSDPFDAFTVDAMRQKIAQKVPSGTNLDYLIYTGIESNQTYNNTKDEIKMIFKNGDIRSITESMDYEILTKIIQKHYLSYLKVL